MVKAVIFDLDDTLISEKRYIQSGYRHIANLLSNRYNKDETEIYELLMELFNISPRNVFNGLLDNLGISYTQTNIIELVEEYRNHLPNIEFFNDVLPCIDILKKKKVKLGIITDGYANAQRKKLKAVKAIEYFDEIIVTDELGREYWKPHPKAFEKMKEELNVNFSEMIYVGDNISKDFITPNGLGMQTVIIYRKNGVYNNSNDIYSEKFHAQYSIKNMNELIQNILKLKSI
jgi:putative hydrolase of the HAD superfamily